MRLIKNYWGRRRSGGGEKEEPVDDIREEDENEKGYKNMMMVLASMDNGPHRELPVDVPDSFMPRNKTPPRYPPPRTHIGGVNGSNVVPAPRDRPPIPAPINNNNTETPTKQQLDSIRKFQEQLRKRKEDEERIAQQELLNWSLRGSKKLEVLQEGQPPVPQTTGVVNDAFTPDLPSLAPQNFRRVVGYGDVVASLQRLQLALKKCGITGLDAQISAVQSVVLSSEFGCALAIYNKLQECLVKYSSPTPVTSQVATTAKECIESLSRSSLSEAVELTEILSKYEVECLLYSHDRVVTELDLLSGTAPSTAMTPAPEHIAAPIIHQTHHAEDPNIKIIKIEKTNEPLGATVRNEGDSVIIGRVVRGGAAEKSGLLHEGDEVLEVNGIEMRGKSVNEVCDLLSTMQGTLTFIIVPCDTPNQPPPPRETIMHMKANFDYDPEDDLYIPCRELGISFQKGDILHVISQEDPNWWQAYREGEEDQTLAGLIPSKSFQHQRESMKQAITGDRFSKKETKKTGTFLCAKKNTKKKKKKSMYGGYDSGYPIYTSGSDDYEVEEILTYDEVALYYPRANHKRPIVLIGPPNIGRHELRQRLMEDSERFAAAVPHTSRARKDGEVDGQDYHFITRAQFEADILARKFVEHGEYEKAYYGTSLDAIRSVVNAGKICVLNLHPQSLRILRTSDLKPYVVFVAPPSLEKLRQKKIRNGEAYKEEELKDIIEKAREMEDRYGHYFDMIINNNDTERAYHQLLHEINILEREPQWVPASWLKSL